MKTQVIASEAAQRCPTQQADMSRNTADKERARWIAERVAAMCDCFPERADAPMPMVQVGAICAILSRYDDETVEGVTCPVNGLASRQRWRPTPYDVKQACEARMKPIRDQWARERDHRRMLEVIEQSPIRPKDSAPPSPEQFVDLQARCGGHTWGLDVKRSAWDRMTPEEAERKLAERAAELGR